jgi:hypothetical protein
MTAPARRQARRLDSTDLIEKITQQGNEWLSHALCTEPADRATAEAAITSLYALVNEPPPTFVWVDSPRQAAEILPPAPPPAPVKPPWSLESRIATVIHRAREGLSHRAPLPPRNAMGSRPDQLTQAFFQVHEKLRTVARESVADVLRAELNTRTGLYWYGQQEVDWIGYFHTYHLFGEVHFRRSDVEVLNLMAAVARSSGWWWPRAGCCTIAERPLVMRTENVDHDDKPRLHNESGPAIVYPDGWPLYAWHGTPVPSWVIDDPTAARIAEETNIEIRRCAIEHIGWAEFIRQAKLTLIGSAPDPANPGAELRLYDLPYQKWGRKTRLLLATNGSVERDGTRKQYGLRVPPWFSDPLDAAAWSYGLTGPQYAELQRRT